LIRSSIFHDEKLARTLDRSCQRVATFASSFIG
jgi:hypothetical protein